MKAIYNCVADNPDELTFSEGEVIVVDGEEDQEWWVSISHALWCFSVRVLTFSDTGISSQTKSQSAPSPAHVPLWSHFHHVDVGTLGNHGGQSKKP